MKKNKKLLYGTPIVGVFIFMCMKRRSEMNKTKNEIKIPSFLKAENVKKEKPKVVGGKLVSKLIEEADKQENNIYVDASELEAVNGGNVYISAEEAAEHKMINTMTEAYKNDLAERTRAYTKEEMEVVLDNIPVELCANRVIKEIKELKEFKRSIKSAVMK